MPLCIIAIASGRCPRASGLGDPVVKFQDTNLEFVKKLLQGPLAINFTKQFGSSYLPATFCQQYLGSNRNWPGKKEEMARLSHNLLLIRPTIIKLIDQNNRVTTNIL